MSVEKKTVLSSVPWAMTRQWRTNVVTAVLILAATVLAGRPGVGRTSGFDGAAPRLGSDLCAACGMVVNEARHAAAVVVGTGGVRRTLALCDTGEVFDLLAQARRGETLGDTDIAADGDANARVVGRVRGLVRGLVRGWVRDDRGWVRAEEAWFVRTDATPTPMMSGFLAFGSQSDAQREARRVGVRAMAFDDAAAERARWRAARGLD